MDGGDWERERETEVGGRKRGGLERIKSGLTPSRLCYGVVSSTAVRVYLEGVGDHHSDEPHQGAEAAGRPRRPPPVQGARGVHHRQVAVDADAARDTSEFTVQLFNFNK